MIQSLDTTEALVGLIDYLRIRLREAKEHAELKGEYLEAMFNWMTGEQKTGAAAASSDGQTFAEAQQRGKAARQQYQKARRRYSAYVWR